MSRSDNGLLDGLYRLLHRLGAGQSPPSGACNERLGRDALAFVVDGRRLATGDVEGLLRVWDVRARAVLRRARFPHSLVGGR